VRDTVILEMEGDAAPLQFLLRPDKSCAIGAESKM